MSTAQDAEDLLERTTRNVAVKGKKNAVGDQQEAQGREAKVERHMRVVDGSH
jgi:hypothetical protein